MHTVLIKGTPIKNRFVFHPKVLFDKIRVNFFNLSIFPEIFEWLFFGLYFLRIVLNIWILYFVKKIRQNFMSKCDKTRRGHAGSFSFYVTHKGPKSPKSPAKKRSREFVYLLLGRIIKQKGLKLGDI